MMIIGQLNHDPGSLFIGTVVMKRLDPGPAFNVLPPTYALCSSVPQRISITLP
jgi:hypothetical protein